MGRALAPHSFFGGESSVSAGARLLLVVQNTGLYLFVLLVVQTTGLIEVIVALFLIA